MRNSKIAAAGLGLLLAAVVPALADNNSGGDDRLRSALRSATSQLRSMEDQNAQLQAKQAESDRALTDAKAKLDADEKELATLRQKSSDQEKAIQSQTEQATTQLQAASDNLTKWQAAYKDAVEKAKARDTEARMFETSLGDMRKRATTCEAKSAKLYDLGLEILDLYQKKGVFESLAGGEPVTGLKRAELENIAQGYGDKLYENKVAVPAQ